ncbi:MAG: hypothetical protein ACXVYB_00110 [Arthrobacter sp.]
MSTKTIKARILDLRESTTERDAYLVVEFEDGGQISALIPPDAEDWEEGIPILVEALAARGYAFAGEPTGDAGWIELIHL